MGLPWKNTVDEVGEEGTAANQELDGVRVDIWTWAVRLYKTRALSGAACKKEQVLVNGQRCRPSRQVRVGDVIEVKKGLLVKTVEVRALLIKRVGAKRVEEFLIDRTPPEVYEAAVEAIRLARESTPQRDAGTGRPTKRERRSLDELMIDSEEDMANFEEFVKSFTRKR